MGAEILPWRLRDRGGTVRLLSRLRAQYVRAC